MTKRIVLSIALAAGLIAALPPAPASAQAYDKLTFLTFSGRVQIPGALLNAGTYRFQLANDTTSRNVLQVRSYDGAIVVAMFHTMPASRVSTTDESTVTFRETPAGVPPAVHAIFWGAEHSGFEFVYPKGQPIMKAELLPQPGITFAAIPEEAVVEAAAAAEPGVVAEPGAVASEPAAAEAGAEPAPATELPKTASALPAVAFGGFTSIVLGLGVGLLLRKRIS